MYQLYGVACLKIASKFEESRVLRIKNLVYICDNTFTPAEIIKAEQ